MSPEFTFTAAPLVTHTLRAPVSYGTDLLQKTIVGFEVLGRPKEQTQNLEEYFSRYAREADPLRYAEFVQSQIEFAGQFERFGWVNLSPEALNREEVRSVVLAFLLEQKSGHKRRVRRYQNIGFEITESEVLTVEAQGALRELLDADYRVAIDDVGSGAHAEPEYITSLVRSLQSVKLKIDAAHVSLDGLSEEVQLLMKLIGRWGISGLTLEGVPVNPTASVLHGNTFIADFSTEVINRFLFRADESRHWQTMLSETESMYRVPVSAQLAPLAASEMHSVLTATAEL